MRPYTELTGSSQIRGEHHMTKHLLSRRQFTVAGLAACSTKLLTQPALIPIRVRRLPAWSPGELDIHHIDTGRGNATFILGPDGTTVLIDCGASIDDLDVSAPIRPDASRQPGEWVARYALQSAQAANRTTLDYLIATHIHPDHVGDIKPQQKPVSNSSFIRTGVSQVDQLMPAKVVIDRSYPDYGLLKPLNAPFASNYLAWLDARARNAQIVQRAHVGSDSQVRLRTPERYPSFSVRILAADGRVWTGASGSRPVFPEIASLPADDVPAENKCSIALLLSYGDFSYFTGGDLTSDTRDGRLPWQDVESAVAEACGRVEVASADHHAYYDACGPAFTKYLNAQAYIIPSWHITHPGSAQLERLLGAWPSVQRHDVFATEMLPVNRLFNARWAQQLQSRQGHVVVRVSPGGGRYQIFVLNSTVENGEVTRTCGPYSSRHSV